MTALSRSAASSVAVAIFASHASTAGAQQAEVAAHPAKPVAPLVSFLSDEDYPAEAARNREQGAVGFRLSIGADGRVQSCAVVRSSGSALLDATTCRLMTTRVRYNPATDARGNPVPDVSEGRIVWRLPDPAEERVDLPERPGAAMQLWSECLWGEAAPLTLSSLAASAVADRALRRCAGLEARAARELTASDVKRPDVPTMVEAFKDDFSTRLRVRLELFRRILGEAGGK